MSSQYIVPDMLATFPCKSALNPMLDEVKDQANAWVKSMALFDPAQLQKFYAHDNNLLAALVVPLESKERLLITCDLMNFYAAVDECTDHANKQETRKVVNGVMNGLRRRKDSIHPSNDKMATIAQEFYQRTVSVVGEDAPGMERFISDVDAYTSAVILEAEDRAAGHLRTVNDYIILRRDTCGAKPTISFLGLGLDIPNAVFENPFMVSLIEGAVDLIAIANDVHSYSRERSLGLGGHNIITVVMQDYHLDLQQALYWISGYTSNVISNFLSNSRAIPSWGEEIDRAVRVYIDRAAQCVRGTDAWSYETCKYYGRDGLRVRESRKSTFLPPDTGVLMSSSDLKT